MTALRRIVNNNIHSIGHVLGIKKINKFTLLPLFSNPFVGLMVECFTIRGFFLDSLSFCVVLTVPWGLWEIFLLINFIYF